MSDGKTLDLRVFQQFFDQIAKGVKTTEYRVMSDYWMRRLADTSKYGDLDEAALRKAMAADAAIVWKPWRYARFHCGKRSLLMRIVSIRAYPSHEWFAIKLAPVKENKERGAS